MARQGFPASGTRYGNHPGVAGYPVAGTRYGAHPDASAVSPPTALDPLTIVTSQTNLFWLVADMGITTGTGVVGWANQGPTGATADASQATGSLQPALVSAGLNSKNYVSADGVDDFLQLAALDIQDPDIFPTWMFFVFRQRAWTVNTSLFGANATTFMRLLQGASASPMLRMNNAVAGAENNGAAINTWTRGEASWANQATDYLKLGSVTGAAAASGGNNPSAGLFTLFAHTIAGAGAIAADIAAFGAWTSNSSSPADPTAGEKAALSAWVTGYYGAGVAV